jgi:hypothetical protein
MRVASTVEARRLKIVRSVGANVLLHTAGCESKRERERERERLPGVINCAYRRSFCRVSECAVNVSGALRWSV